MKIELRNILRAAHLTENDGMLPVHTACKAKDASMVSVLQARPQAAQRQANNGNSPLHWLLSMDIYLPYLWETRALCEVWPDAAKTQNKDGLLPLHIACFDYKQNMMLCSVCSAFGPMLQWSETVYSGFFLLISFTKKNYGHGKMLIVTGKTPPLHFACQYAAELSTMKGIIADVSRYKARPAEEYFQGMLPLHRACDSEGAISREKFDYIVQLYPQAVRIPSFTGEHALHYGCRSKYLEWSTILRLIALYPGAAEASIHGGSLLHDACRYGRNECTIVGLSRLYPELLTTAEDSFEGWFPLHLASMNDIMSVSAIFEMVSLSPASLQLSLNTPFRERRPRAKEIFPLVDLLEEE